MAVKLNQIIAVEKGVKERTHKQLTALYQGLNKTEPMQGISRTYQPLNDDGEALPPEQKYVQVNCMDAVETIRGMLTDLFDVTYTKEVGNTKAKASVVVDGKAVVKDVPVTYLLFLEKQLTDMRTVLGALPKLDPADKWSFDDQQGFFKSEPVKTARTKKVTEFVVVPGSGVPEKGVKPDVKDVTNDVLAGYWTTVKFSACMEPTRVEQLVERVDGLLRAVKMAREEANMTEVENLKIASAVMDHVFAS